MIGLGLVHFGSEGAVKACANARLLRAGLSQLGTPLWLRSPKMFQAFTACSNWRACSD